MLLYRICLNSEKQKTAVTNEWQLMRSTLLFMHIPMCNGTICEDFRELWTFHFVNLRSLLLPVTTRAHMATGSILLHRDALQTTNVTFARSLCVLLWGLIMWECDAAAVGAPNWLICWLLSSDIQLLQCFDSNGRHTLGQEEQSWEPEMISYLKKIKNRRWWNMNIV